MKKSASYFLLLLIPLVVDRGDCRGQPYDHDGLLVQTEVELLVEQLGHGEFTQREAATQRLLEIGLPAAAALERGQDHADREIRYRCARVLTRVRQRQRRHRLAAFVAYRDSAHSPDLPGWSRFSQLVGDSARSRALFAKMLESEWDLLARAENPAEISQALSDRCVELEQARSMFRQTPTLETVASLLLLASDEHASFPDTIGTKLYGQCSVVPAFRQSLESNGKYASAIRSLVGAWVQRSDATMTGFYCLNLAMRYDLKEGLGLAERILASDNVMTPRYREYAVLTIAKLGSDEHVSILEPLLDDPTVCQQRTDPKTKIKTQTQVRDIALAAIIFMSGEHPKKFGFAQLRENPTYVFVSSTAGFASDQQREESRRKWQEFSSRVPARP